MSNKKICSTIFGQPKIQRKGTAPLSTPLLCSHNISEISDEVIDFISATSAVGIILIS